VKGTTMRTESICLALVLAACGEPGDSANPEELITTVTLAFTPAGGGAAIVAEFDDPDGDGGEPPTIDPIDLPAGDYELAVGFENRLEDPPEIITDEVSDEADEHQVFFTGTAVDGPLIHAYDDEDADGLPIGLVSTITAVAGTGVLTVTLRHLPPVNDVTVKVAGLAEDVAADGITSIGGETDASVDFDVTVP